MLIFCSTLHLEFFDHKIDASFAVDTLDEPRMSVGVALELFDLLGATLQLRFVRGDRLKKDELEAVAHAYSPSPPSACATCLVQRLLFLLNSRFNRLDSRLFGGKIFVFALKTLSASFRCASTRHTKSTPFRVAKTRQFRCSTATLRRAWLRARR